MKTRYVIIAIFCISLPGLSGCAFFNTYFNARKAFNNGKAALERSWEQKSLQRQPTQAITAERFDEDYMNVPDDAKQFFSTAIEKGNKVVVLHPDSRWVEPAILLLGKAHFLRGTGNDYYDAKNRFEVFFLKYPNSKLYAEAQLWFARTLIRMNLEYQAFPILQQITTMPVTADIRAESHLLLGDQYFREDRLNDALTEFIIADSLARRISLRKQAAFKAAMILFNQERFSDAYRYFKKLSRYDMTPPDFFDVTLLMAKSLKYQGKFDAAIKLLDKILGDNRYKNQYVAAESEIADILIRQGRIKEAEKQLKYIIDTYRIQQFTGDAYFRLGSVYDTIYNEPDQAVKFYYIVKTKYPQTSFLPLAEQRFVKLSRLEYFYQTIRSEKGLIRWMNRMILHPDSLKQAAADTSELYEEQVDSLKKDSSSVTIGEIRSDTLSLTDDISSLMDTLNLDSLEWLQKLEFTEEDDNNFGGKTDNSKTGTDKQASDTAKVKSVYEKDLREAFIDNKELKERLQFIRNEKIRLRNLREVDSMSAGIIAAQERIGGLYFDLADFFFYNARQTDSSLFYYSFVVDSFFHTSSAEPALYAIAGVYEKTEPARYLPALRKAYQTFPEGKLAHLYHKIFPSDNTETDSIHTLLVKAENDLVNSDFESALDLYHQVALLDTSEVRGRALFMMGTIQEKLQMNESAYRFFNTLSFAYPNHPLSLKIKPKVNEYAKNMKIPADSTVFFVDTQYVKVDFSMYIKKMKITESDTATDSIKIKEPSNADSLIKKETYEGGQKKLDDAGNENHIEETDHIKDNFKIDSTGLKPRKESNTLEGLNVKDSTDVNIEKDEKDE